MTKSTAVKWAKQKAEQTGQAWMVYWDRSLSCYCLTDAEWAESEEGRRVVKEITYTAGGLK